MVSSDGLHICKGAAAWMRNQHPCAPGSSFHHRGAESEIIELNKKRNLA